MFTGQNIDFGQHAGGHWFFGAKIAGIGVEAHTEIGQAFFVAKGVGGNFGDGS